MSNTMELGVDLSLLKLTAEWIGQGDIARLECCGNDRTSSGPILMGILHDRETWGLPMLSNYPLCSLDWTSDL